MADHVKPTVSIIMPCFNCAHHVGRAIACVLGQSLEDFELLFIDDGSTDGSAAVAAGFSDSRMHVLRQANAGVSATRNRGLAAARGTYIAFLDADDTWEPRFLEKMVSALGVRPETALAYCGWQNIGLSGGRGAPFVPPDYEIAADKCAHLVECCRWPIHAALTRCAAIDAAGGFNESFAVGEDFLLWMEIGCFNPIVRVSEVLAYYYHHGGAQATKNKMRTAVEAYRAQSFFLGRHPEVGAKLGAARVRELTLGPLLSKGYTSYWAGDLDTARAIFRMVMGRGYGRLRDWKHMLPALFPRSVHRGMLNLLGKVGRTNDNR